MNTFKRVLVDGLIGFVVALGAATAMAVAITAAGKAAYASMDGVVLDCNEQARLMFMREEEKLARDVYMELGAKYPVFGKIDDSEQKHTHAVKAMIEKYGLEDPDTNDNVGAYTSDYGWYFTEKFNELIERASISELEALYVGASIEELDMMDVNQ